MLPGPLRFQLILWGTHLPFGRLSIVPRRPYKKPALIGVPRFPRGCPRDPELDTLYTLEPVRDPESEPTALGGLLKAMSNLVGARLL